MSTCVKIYVCHQSQRSTHSNVIILKRCNGVIFSTVLNWLRKWFISGLGFHKRRRISVPSEWLSKGPCPIGVHAVFFCVYLTEIFAQAVNGLSHSFAVDLCLFKVTDLTLDYAINEQYAPIIWNSVVVLAHSVRYRVLCGSKSSGFLCGFAMKYGGKRVGGGIGVNTRGPFYQAKLAFIQNLV